MTPLASLIMAAAAAQPSNTLATQQPPSGAVRLATANPLTAGIFFAATPTDTSLAPILDDGAGVVNVLDHLSQACTGWTNQAVNGKNGGVHFDYPRVDSDEFTFAMLVTASHHEAYGAHTFVAFHGQWNMQMNCCISSYAKDGRCGMDIKMGGSDMDSGYRIELKPTADLVIFRLKPRAGLVYNTINGRKSVNSFGNTELWTVRANYFGKSDFDGTERTAMKLIMPLVVGWKRFISDDEEASFIANPWQIYQG